MLYQFYLHVVSQLKGSLKLPTWATPGAHVPGCAPKSQCRSSLKKKSGPSFGGFQLVMGVPQYGWFISWKIPYQWMITRGSPISGKPHLVRPIDVSSSFSTQLVQGQSRFGTDPDLEKWRSSTNICCHEFSL